MRPPNNKYAKHAVSFISNLTLCGDDSGKPFKLRPWQQNIIRRIFGTVDRKGNRQYQRVFLFLPSGNGKTQIAAAIALYCLICWPPGQQIVSAAADREQSARIFDAARQMIEGDEFLSSLVTVVASQKRLVVESKHCFFVALAHDARRRQGLNPSVVLADEMHCHPNGDLCNMLTAKMAKRQNPLFIGITTAGLADVNHIAFQEFEYARKVASKEIDNPAYLPILFQASGR